MKTRNFLAVWLIVLLTLTNTLLAKEYNNTSYYVAYDTADKTEFVLVMPSVNKVYTHKAGHILAEDLKQIDTQFKTFPTYNDGELCFSALIEGASGKDGASVMEGECYTVNFFYTQKEAVEGEGMAFILIYTPAAKVYEGLAGDAGSFKVVKEGEATHNKNSISGDDYTFFNFSTTEGKASILTEEPNSSLFDSTLSPVIFGNWYKPNLDTSWQWQLTGSINTSYDVEIYDIDLFDSSKTLIQSLKDEDRKVICYFSAGSYEEWREDANNFPVAALGDDMDGWAGEKWLDISNEALAPIMRERLDLAAQKGCDGVEPDNMDGYTNNTGFTLSADAQLAYNKFIANEARKRGLSVGLKNDLDQIVELEPFFDFSVNEQCYQYNECEKMQPFIDANKPVLNAEYTQKYVDNTNGERDTMCADTLALQFQTLVLPYDLDDSFRYSCD